MRELTIVRGHAVGKYLLRALGQLHFGGAGEPATPAFACGPVFFLLVARYPFTGRRGKAVE
jgi:hypothetical protein